MNGEDPSVPRRDKGKQKAVDQDEVSDDPDSEEPRVRCAPGKCGATTDSAL